MGMTNILEGYRDVLRPEDVREILQIGRNSVYTMLKNGDIKSIIIGGKYRIPKLYMLEYIYPDKDFTTTSGGDDNGEA